MADCIFCKIIAGEAPVQLVYEWEDTLAFFPLNPVTEGHTLVVPRVHVDDYAHNPEVTAQTMLRAAQLMQWTQRDSNIITSKGSGGYPVGLSSSSPHSATNPGRRSSAALVLRKRKPQ